MIKVSNIVVFAGIAVVLAWGASARSQHVAAARANAVAVYKLNTQQATVYDECLDAISQKRLKNGGSKESFCGCFAGSAARDEYGIKYSASILKQSTDEADKDRTARMTSMSRDPQYFLAFVKTVAATVDCAKD